MQLQTSETWKQEPRQCCRFTFFPQTQSDFSARMNLITLFSRLKWIEFYHVTVNDEGCSWGAFGQAPPKWYRNLETVPANWSRGECEPVPYEHLLTSPIVLQRLQYFHKLWKDNLVLDSQYWVISRDPLLAMYYSRVFKPHSGPGRKCSLPASVTGYQPLIYYSTCWSKATQSNSLWCCLDRREERGTTEAARRPLVFSLFPNGRTEGVTTYLCWTVGLELTWGRQLWLLDSC